MMDLGNDTEEVVGVICVDSHGKILVVQGYSGKWSFPKGRRKEKETSYAGALREAKEEAGIDLSDLTSFLTIKLRYGSYYCFYFNYPGEYYLLDAPMTPQEVKKVDWVNARSPSFKKEDKNADLRTYISTSPLRVRA